MAGLLTDRRRAPVDPSSALAAALLLAIQIVVGGLWMGAHAAPAGTDAFGHMLCAWSGSDAGGDRPAGHAPFPDCCATGCSLAWAEQDDAFAASAPAVESTVFVQLPARDDRFVRLIDRASIRSRGPPRSV